MRLNPPIRGSIGMILWIYSGTLKKSQSPYKGFNSKEILNFMKSSNSLNPPIRGSIAVN